MLPRVIVHIPNDNWHLCVGCGKIEKRDYTNAPGYARQSVVIREATCETDGKALNICQRCGEAEVSVTGKGEHEYTSYPVAATCVNPGYTVKECGICGDCHITDITSALAHSYKIPAKTAAFPIRTTIPKSSAMTMFLS